MNLPLWKLTTARRKIFELFGNSKYSHPAFYEIENEILQRVPSAGFFVEAGAVDGFFESNTYFIEQFCGWRGILIEPIPEMFRRIHVNRPKAMAFNCALVANELENPTVFINNNHAMSSISEIAGGINNNSKSSIKIQGRTLTSILLEADAPKIDLLSLDVEGYELEVLKGLDLSIFRPTYILCECLAKKNIIDTQLFLSNYYSMVKQITHRDFLFEINQ